MHTVMTDHQPTEALVEKAKAGDRSAFDALVDEFRSRLRSRIESWAQFQIGPRLESEEVLQDTFVRAFRSLARFEWHDDDAFFRWLCGIAKNVIADLARSARRDARRAGADVDIDVLPVNEPSPSKAARRDERFDRLSASLAELSADYRQVLVLSRIDGLTMSEIGERIGRSPNAVKHLMARALRALKESFGDTESLHLGARELSLEEPDDE